MAKRVQEATLDTRTARLKLPAQHKPHFRLLADGLHLGYRRSTVPRRAGTWLARRYIGDGKYETGTLGSADDSPDMVADGDKILTFTQASAAARDWSRRRAAQARGATAPGVVVAVKDAVAVYVAARKARSLKAGRDAELRLNHHVSSAPLASVPLLELRERDLATWRKGLQRGGRGVKDDAPPIAPATLARLLNDVRAALNSAARKARAPADLLTIIREGLAAPEAPDRARELQVLADAQVRRAVDIAPGVDEDFGALVLVLATTGARLSQAERITVADLQVGQRRIMVPTSRKGRGGKKQIERTPVPIPDDVLARLAPLAHDRPGREPLLMRWHHVQVAAPDGGTRPVWVRDKRKPWTSPSQLSRPWREVVKRAGLPTGTVPLALRHSSIVRGLRAGLPVRLVAATHDTSVAMIEKHYAAFIVDASEDLLRRAAMPLTTESSA